MTHGERFFPPDLDWLPKPPALERDPEFALLAVLHTALETLVFALLASHPHLATPDPPPDPETLAAHRLMVSVWHFQHQLDRYAASSLGAALSSVRLTTATPATTSDLASPLAIANPRRLSTRSATSSASRLRH